jgi:Mo-co oxidoreductase dimerisation domain
VANLDSEHAKYAWRLWHFEWRPPQPGEYSILSRATDEAGRVQPITPQWNPGGYLWNGVDRVRVQVEA